MAESSDRTSWNLTGWDGGQTPTFQRLVEAVEFTATQRGVERWKPKEAAARSGALNIGAGISTTSATSG